jgi:hypothetical protein
MFPIVEDIDDRVSILEKAVLQFQRAYWNVSNSTIDDYYVVWF